METVHANAGGGKPGTKQGRGIRQQKLSRHACDVKLMSGSRADHRNTRVAPACHSSKKQWRHAFRTNAPYFFISVVLYKNNHGRFYPREAQITYLQQSTVSK